MNLQIERPYLEAMISEFPRLAPLRDQLRFGNKVTLPLYQFNGAELGFLSNLYREAGPALRTRAAQLATLQQAFDGQGTGFYAEDPTATHRDTDWSRKDAVRKRSASLRS
ncbi:MAG: hypothetical protein M1449_00075 [Candidatus Thermoplasmatota archaeon]|nr:hypothetical protein [Candidatus Thermoplasmatota archaeon]